MKIRSLILISIVAILLPACMTAQEHRRAVQDDGSDRMTVGKVQREIKVGMSSAEVAQVLGSPNIVTTDEQRREVWVYDKIATDRAFSTSSGGVSTLILGGALPGAGLIGGLAGGHADQSAGASSTSQRTLTVIIKFDENSKVRDFAYHTSRF